MKKLVLAAAFAGLSTSAFAGGMEAPVIVPEVIIEEVETAATGTSQGIILPIIIIALLAAAAS
ncbi:MAG: hypothetical protein ACU0CI_11715 [Shimia sp.]